MDMRTGYGAGMLFGTHGPREPRSESDVFPGEKALRAPGDGIYFEAETIESPGGNL